MSCWLENRCNKKDCGENKFCLRKYKLDTLYNNSLLSEKQREKISLFVDKDGTDLNEFKQLSDIQANIEAFVLAGKNLYIHSCSPGTGKTSWAIRLIQAYFDKIWPKTDLGCKALFISVPRFLLAIKENISVKSEYVEFIKQNITQADIVVWDDLGTKIGTSFELEHLLSLIDSRIALNKSNIYTSNLGVKDMYTAIGERLASRVCQYSLDIEFHGADKRKIGGNN